MFLIKKSLILIEGDLAQSEMSKTFSACQTFGLTNLEKLPDRMKTCQTEYRIYIAALVEPVRHSDQYLSNFCQTRANFISFAGMSDTFRHLCQLVERRTSHTGPMVQTSVNFTI